MTTPTHDEIAAAIEAVSADTSHNRATSVTVSVAALTALQSRVRESALEALAAYGQAADAHAAQMAAEARLKELEGVAGLVLHRGVTWRDCTDREHQIPQWVADKLAAALPPASATAAYTAAIRAAEVRGIREAGFIAYDEEDETILRPWENWGEHRNMVTAQTVQKEIRTAILAAATAKEKAHD